MNIQHDVSLATCSTMRLGGTAKHLVVVRSREELLEAVRWAHAQDLPIITIGTGSNIVWQDSGFDGLVIVNDIPGFAVDGSLLTVGAGEIWDSVVKRSVEAGLTGIEALSLIPGTAGATPVQNVGAYGQEISQTLASVDVLDVAHGKFITLPADELGLGYRDSKFKHEWRGHYIIVSLTFKLLAGRPEPPFYASVQTYFDDHNLHNITSDTLRNAVVAIRSAKLPNPREVANNGSFFANPTVDEVWLGRFPNAPHWGHKVSAAWLIQEAGFADYHDEATGMGTWPSQPLVLINEHARSTADLLAFRKRIVSAVFGQFGVTLHQEPELLP